jgi:hypothetical protein
MGGISPSGGAMPESVSTENVTVAYVLAAAELTKAVTTASDNAEKLAANYKVIYKAVTTAGRGD